MNRDQMIKKISAINNLPTLPVIALEVNRLLQDYESPVDQLVALLEKDQSLVVKILKLVNSSFYGFKSRVNNIRHAVTLLGFNTVRNAVVTLSIIDAMILKQTIKGFDIDIFWRHSICVAVVSRYVAATSRLAAREDAFTAGLLHDIGKVVLASNFTDDLKQILETVENDGIPFFQAEEKLGSCPHNLIGSFLAQRWLLPEPLVKTIQYHHSKVDRSAQNQLITIVDMGNRLVHMMAGDRGYTLHSDTALEQGGDLHTIMNCLKDQHNWLPMLRNEMNEACDFFDKG